MGSQDKNLFESGWAAKAVNSSFKKSVFTSLSDIDVRLKETAYFCTSSELVKGQISLNASSLEFEQCESDKHSINQKNEKLFIIIGYNKINCSSLINFNKTEPLNDFLKFAHKLILLSILDSEIITFLKIEVSATSNIKKNINKHSKLHHRNITRLTSDNISCIISKKNQNSFNSNNNTSSFYVEDLVDLEHQIGSISSNKNIYEQNDRNQFLSPYKCIDTSNNQILSIKNSNKSSMDKILSESEKLETLQFHNDSKYRNTKYNSVKTSSDKLMLFFFIPDKKKTYNFFEKLLKIGHNSDKSLLGNRIQISEYSNVLYDKILHLSSMNSYPNYSDKKKNAFDQLIIDSVDLHHSELPNKLFDQKMAVLLLPSLPMIASSKKFFLLFDTNVHGVSLNTFYSRVKNKKYCIILIKTSTGCVFGGFSLLGFKNSLQYYGDGETFVFTYGYQNHSAIKVFYWSKKSSLFIFSNNKKIVFGSDAPAIVIESCLTKGHCGISKTFDNKMLCDEHRYDICRIQVWFLY